MADMSTAPKNGERILLKIKHRWNDFMENIIECYYEKGWKEWHGKGYDVAINGTPIAWMHVPDELKTPTAPVDGHPDRPIGDNSEEDEDDTLNEGEL